MTMLKRQIVGKFTYYYLRESRYQKIEGKLVEGEIVFNGGPYQDHRGEAKLKDIVEFGREDDCINILLFIVAYKLGWIKTKPPKLGKDRTKFGDDLPDEDALLLPFDASEFMSLGSLAEYFEEEDIVEEVIAKKPCELLSAISRKYKLEGVKAIGCHPDLIELVQENITDPDKVVELCISYYRDTESRAQIKDKGRVSLTLPQWVIDSLNLVKGSEILYEVDTVNGDPIIKMKKDKSKK